MVAHPLEESVRQFLESSGYRLVLLSRMTKHKISLLISNEIDRYNYLTISAFVSEDLVRSEEVDDALYDQATKGIEMYVTKKDGR